jgi:NADPH:quinone reductase-like Zn-dependent oxidoreductase
MRAFAVRSFGEAPAIHELPVPAADGAFLIRVTYAGVNPVDFKLLDRLNEESKFPFVVGIDFAGVVERVPTGETSIHAGDHVFGMARTHGPYAEYTAIAPGGQTEPLARVPDGVSDDRAAALPIPAITALGSLEIMDIAPDQKLLVTGATGGVGGYAVQMAVARGAHVIATVHGDVDEARNLGAEEVYDATVVDVADAVRTAHPDGIDAVFDLVNGPDAIQRNVEILKEGGKLVSAIYAADEAWFAKRLIKAHNIASNTNPKSSPQGLDEVAAMLADGTITARIRRVGELDEAGQILEKLRKGGLHGKAVIRL